MAPHLSDEQKRTLYRDGYGVVKEAVAPELVEAARARIKHAMCHMWEEWEGMQEIVAKERSAAK